MTALINICVTITHYVNKLCQHIKEENTSPYGRLIKYSGETIAEVQITYN